MSLFPTFRIDARMNFESEWGIEQDSGHFVLPHRRFGLSMRKKPFKPAMNTGNVRRAHQIQRMNSVGGRIHVPFLRHTAYNLLKWCLTRHGAGDAAWSATVDKKTPVGIRRYTGCVVEKARFYLNFLSGEASLNLDVRGRLEKTNGISMFDTPIYADEAPFMARYAAVELWGSADPLIEDLAFVVSNVVEEGPVDDDGNVFWLAAARRDISGGFRLVYEDDAYTDYLTGETKGSVQVVLAHPVGGSNDTITLKLPEVLMVAADPTTDLDGIVRQQVDFNAEADDNGDDITWSVS